MARMLAKWVSLFGENNVIICLDTILRVPGLFLIEVWYNSLKEDGFFVQMYEGFAFENGGPALESVLVSLVSLVLGFILLSVSLGDLVQIHLHLLALGLLVFGDLMSEEVISDPAFLSVEAQEKDPVTSSIVVLRRVVFQFSCYLALSIILTRLLDLQDSIFRHIPLFYVLPIIVRLAGFGEDSALYAHEVAGGLVRLGISLYVLTCSGNIISNFMGLCYDLQLLASIHGTFALATEFLMSIASPPIMFTFYACLVIQTVWTEFVYDGNYILKEGLYDLPMSGIIVMAHCCYSPLSLVASCIFISSFARGVIELTYLFLNSCKATAPASNIVRSGLMEGLVLFLLALQTDLMEMEALPRIAAMTVILYIVIASLLQTLLEITHPVLLAISASSRNVMSHIKVLGLCAILFLLPLTMSWYILNGTSKYFDVWTMVVVSSSLLTSIQVIGHVVHYCLFLYDSFQSEPLESLDTIVFYLKAAIHSLELISALFIVGAGAKDAYTSDTVDPINLLILAAHTYSNVWLRIRKGWSKFMLRQAAVAKIEALETATAVQVAAHGDVCSICYMDMDPARSEVKITPCNHFFHSNCLRKWLLVQEHCPMCSKKICPESSTRAQDGTWAGADEGAEEGQDRAGNEVWLDGDEEVVEVTDDSSVEEEDS